VLSPDLKGAYSLYSNLNTILNPVRAARAIKLSIIMTAGFMKVCMELNSKISSPVSRIAVLNAMAKNILTASCVLVYLTMPE